MSDRDQSVTSSEEASQVSDRRAFLKTAGKAAATAPAVALLLSAAAKPASAHSRYGCRERGGKRHNGGSGGLGKRVRRKVAGKRVARKKAAQRKAARKKAVRKKAGR
jgi:hypothetical protein